MTTRAATRNKLKKPLETTLGKAPTLSSGDPIDLSHIRKPIDTSIFGFSQVLSLFETATDEVRNYITYECDVMYECRTCRTIFRSLANFVLHKRNYCRELFSQSKHKMCQQNSFYVVEENEQRTDNVDTSHSKNKRTNETTTEPLPKYKKNLRRVLSRLANKQESSLITKECLTEDLSGDSKSSSDVAAASSNVALQPIDDTKSGVFQTMFRQMAQVNSKMDLMKTEVMEIHDILENNEAIIGPDGKISVPDSQKNAILVNNFICTVCNQKFSTTKTLRYHFNYKHNNSRLVFKCPECSDIFANAWCVFRHLYKIHRKTTAQVKRLRNEIYANKVKKEDWFKEAEKDQKDSRPKIDLQGKLDLENQQWMDDLEGDNDLQRCGGCGRKFERKAALHSHSQFCTKRIAVCNTIKENIKKVQSEEKQEKAIKTVKTAVSAVENGSRSRRRKPLVARKLWRYDYIKDVEKTEEGHSNSEIDTAVKGDVVMRDLTITNITETKMVDKIENTTESDIVVGDSTNSKVTETKMVDETETTTESDIVVGDLTDPNITETKLVNKSENATKINIVVRDLTVADVTETKMVDETEITTKSDIVVGDLTDSNITETKMVDKSENATKINIVVRDLTVANVTKTKIADTSNDNHNPVIDLASNTEPVLEQNEIQDKSNNSDDVIYLNTIRLPPENINTSPILKTSLLVPNDPHVINNEIIISDNSNSTPFFEVNNDEVPALNCVPANVNNRIENNNNRKVTEAVKRKMDEVTDVTESSSKYMKVQAKISLETKASNYIDKEKLICSPCRKTFKSYKSLMKHMALHFNWFRYQCLSCQYMTYQRSKCERHIQQIHMVQDRAALKNHVCHIPVWKTIEISTNFKKCCKKHHFEENLYGAEKSVLETDSITQNLEEVSIMSMESTTTEDDCTIITENAKSNSPDPTLRQMIMEVIFGSDVPSVDHTKVKMQNVSVFSQTPERESPKDVTVLKDNSRPVRNRTVPVQKDFLYDMKQVLKPTGVKDKETQEVNDHEPKPLKVYTKKLRAQVKKCAPDDNGNVASVPQHDVNSRCKD